MPSLYNSPFELIIYYSPFGEVAEPVEGSRLLSGYRGNTLSRVRIPASPPFSISKEVFMKSKIIPVLVVLSMLVAAYACQKKEEQPVPKAAVQSPMATPSDLNQPVPPHGQAAMPPAGQAAMPPQGNMGSKDQKTIQVPEDVKKSWGKVKLVFTDKAAKKTREYTVNTSSEFEIQGTGLKVAVSEFLPDLKMIGSNITSGSNEPVNPAVRVEIFEKGKSIHKGWLFAKMPDIHPFENDKYGLILKEGLRK